MVQKEPVSKEEWQFWKQNKVTKALVANLIQRRMELLEEWAEGRCPSDLETHKQEGRVQNLKDVIMYIIQDFEVIEPMEKETKSGN